MPAGHEIPGSSPPMANYERPKPVVHAGKVAPQPTPAAVTHRLIVGDAVVVVAVAEAEDGTPVVTLQHEYEGFEPENEFVSVSGREYLLLHRDGQTLILEAA